MNNENIEEFIDVSNINFPCSYDDIKKFSNRTKTNMLVLGYYFDKN